MKRLAISLRRACAVGAALAVLMLCLGVAAVAQTTADVQFYGLRLGGGTKTATAVAGAVTLNKHSGVITSEALTTVAGSTYVLTMTNSAIKATDIVLASNALGTATTGLPEISSIKPANGSVVITVRNATGAATLNGTITIAFIVIKGY